MHPSLATAEDFLWLAEEAELLPRRTISVRYPRPDLPEAWEPHESEPGWSAAEHIAEVERAEQEAKTDWLTEQRRKHGAVPPGRYVATLAPEPFDTFKTKANHGLLFAIDVTEGEWTGCRIRLRLALGGEPLWLVRTNTELIFRWAALLKVEGPSRDELDLLARLGEAGEDRRLTFDIRERVWRNGRDLELADVEAAR